jgi:ribosomal protein S18 acetylase RimI-like enzyme
MKTRTYTPADHGALKQMVIALQAYERGFDEGRVEPTEAFAEWYIKKLFAVLQRERGLTLMAEVDGKAVGFVSGFVDEEWEYREQYFYIAKLSVLPEHRGKGIGSALIQAMEEHARRQGFKRVGIGVISPSERVYGLYHRLGYADHLVRLRKNIA